MRLLEFGRARARWRIMSLMGLVAFSAVAIWSVKTTTEFYRFRKIRAQRLSKAAVQGMFRQIMEKNPTPSPPPALNQWIADSIRYHKDMEEKYRKGAAEPWVDLNPDPPEPPLPVDLGDIRKMNSIRSRAARIASDLEKGKLDTKPENSPIEENPEPASPLDSDQTSRRLDTLQKRRVELMRELEEKKREVELMRELTKRRLDTKPENNSVKEKPDFL